MEELRENINKEIVVIKKTEIIKKEPVRSEEHNI